MVENFVEFLVTLVPSPLGNLALEEAEASFSVPSFKLKGAEQTLFAVF